MELLIAFRERVGPIEIDGVDGRPEPSDAAFREGMVGLVGWEAKSSAWLWSKSRPESSVIDDVLAATSSDLVVFDESDVEICRRQGGVVTRAVAA